MDKEMKNVGGITMVDVPRDDKKAVKTLLDGIPERFRDVLKEAEGVAMGYVEETKTAYLIYLQDDRVICFTLDDLVGDQADEIFDKVGGEISVKELRKLYESVRRKIDTSISMEKFEDARIQAAIRKTIDDVGIDTIKREMEEFRALSEADKAAHLGKQFGMTPPFSIEDVQRECDAAWNMTEEERQATMTERQAAGKTRQ